MKILTSSVPFQDEKGNVLANGSLILTLQSGTYLILSGGGQVFGGSCIINLDSQGKLPAGTSIWASDELLSQPIFGVTICAGAKGLAPVAFTRWNVTGTSPIDVSRLPQQA